MRRSAPAAGETITVTRVRVPVNKSQTMRVVAPFSDILIGASKIAEVIPLSDQTLYILGKEVGTTNVSLVDANKKVIGVVDVEVGLDAGNIGAKVLGGSGARGVRFTTEGDKAVLTGTAEDAVAADRAVALASNLAPGGVMNMTTVRSTQQVMLKVRFIEIDRTAGRDLGVRWEGTNRSVAGRSGTVAATPEALTTAPGGNGIGLLSNAIPAVAGAALSTVAAPQFGQFAARLINSNSAKVDLFISALETQGLARRLAEPNLVASSGQPAEFLAGGEYPIPTASSSGALGVPTITVTFKEFGVRLTFTPTVLSNGLINLQLEPEVSEIDPAISVNTGLVTVPGLSKRRARTNIEMRDGQSFAIAGLLQAVNEKNLEQLPWLGSIPVLGALFSSKEFRQRDTELVVIVTPHLVKPSKPGQPLATPLDTRMPTNDADYFLGGQTELPKSKNPGKPSRLQELISAEGAAIGSYGHVVKRGAAN
ncbi:type II and III secretion system protein family protein [Methylobacterium nodulans]|uniref:Type II and III secretion system protein n=1 Tax=Methylobacterium nodulans (strain LMG 21967 / CNCM I-2342 / ORS 2060) TaxID=460265 RepID=B8IDY5_METNO|nr:type II and III secretion system protein family protein [Methylobacterium nodulans]ACL57531.1 type II and III secretion system protein [Methylobacterium nodulans ORS 2060]